MSYKNLILMILVFSSFSIRAVEFDLEQEVEDYEVEKKEQKTLSDDEFMKLFTKKYGLCVEEFRKLESTKYRVFPAETTVTQVEDGADLSIHMKTTKAKDSKILAELTMGKVVDTGNKEDVWDVDMNVLGEVDKFTINLSVNKKSRDFTVAFDAFSGFCYLYHFKEGADEKNLKPEEETYLMLLGNGTNGIVVENALLDHEEGPSFRPCEEDPDYQCPPGHFLEASGAAVEELPVVATPEASSESAEKAPAGEPGEKKKRKRDRKRNKRANPK